MDSRDYYQQLYGYIKQFVAKDFRGRLFQHFIEDPDADRNENSIPRRILTARPRGTRRSTDTEDMLIVWVSKNKISRDDLMLLLDVEQLQSCEWMFRYKFLVADRVVTTPPLNSTQFWMYFNLADEPTQSIDSSSK